MKKFTAFLISFCILLSSVPVFSADYDEEAIYNECYLLYPSFVDKVKSFGVSDKQIITFLGSVEENLSTYAQELTEENFDEYMFNAIKSAFGLRKNIKVRDALAKAYPDAVPDAMKAVVPEEYMPIYNTVKRILFGIKTPVITLSGSADDLSVNHVNMPGDATIYVGFYDSEGSLIKAVSDPTKNLSCSCESLSFITAYAWSKESLSPLCDPYTLKIR